MAAGLDKSTLVDFIATVERNESDSGSNIYPEKNSATPISFNKAHRQISGYFYKMDAPDLRSNNFILSENEIMLFNYTEYKFCMKVACFRNTNGKVVFKLKFVLSEYIE